MSVTQASIPIASVFSAGPWVMQLPAHNDHNYRDHDDRPFGLLMIRRPKISGLLMLAWPVIRYFTESIFTEDRLAVEDERQTQDAQGGDWNREISPVLLDLRRMLENGVPFQQSWCRLRHD